MPKGPQPRAKRIRVIGQHGLEEVLVRDPADRSLIAQHRNAVDMFLETGDDYVLEFEGETIVTTDGRVITLLTNRDELERRGFAGEFSFESIYVRRG